MNEFMDFARTIFDVLKIAMKENIFMGLGFVVVFIGFLLYPVLMLVYLPKGWEQRSWSPEEMREENKKGLSSRTGRVLTLLLAVILFSMAWAVRGIYLFMVPLLLAGAAAIYVALRPEAGAGWFTPAPAGKGSPWLANAVGVLLLMVSGWQFHLYLQASDAEKHWTHVTGIVRDAGVSKAPSGGKGGASVYMLLVNYSYAVDGITFTSNPVEVDMETIYTDKDSALETLHALYPKGGKVDVYCDPLTPEHSTLGKAATGGLMFPVVFLLAALAVFMRG